MKKIAMIPARYAATRFHGKLMELIGDKTLIRATYESTVATGVFDEVIVVTDSELIRDEIISHGGKAMMSRKPHESGSDRIAEAVAELDVDVVVNVQGDEPFANREVLQKLVDCFEGEKGKEVKVASAMVPLTDTTYLSNPNFAKVVTDKNNNALYFSRSMIPFDRSGQGGLTFYKQIGVYAFRKQTLLDFTQWPVGRWENIEKLEQLRYLENGVPIRMVTVEKYEGLGVDSVEELERVRELITKGV